MVDGRIAIAQNSLFEGKALQKDDQDRVRNPLDSIALVGRIASTGDGMVFKKGFELTSFDKFTARESGWKSPN